MSAQVRWRHGVVLLAWLPLAAGLAGLALAGSALWKNPAAAQSPPAAAQPTQTSGAQDQLQPAPIALPAEITQSLTRLATAIDASEKTVENISTQESDLGQLRIDVEGLLNQSAQTAEQLRPQLAAVKSQIAKLGAAPGKDGPPEPAAIAAERARLTGLAANLDGAIKAAELAWVRARQLIERITVMRHSIFTKNLLQRLPSPLLPGLWRNVITEAPAVGRRVDYLAEDWWHWAGSKPRDVGALLSATLLLYLILRAVTGRLTDRRGSRTGEPQPSFFERAMAVAWVAPLHALPVAASVLLLYGGLDAIDLLYPPWENAAASIAKAALVMTSVGALIFGVLSPGAGQWRLVSLADRSARRIGLILRAMTAVYAIDVALTEMSRAFFVPLTLSVVQSFVATTAFAALLICLLLTPFEAQDESIAQPASRHVPRWLKLPLWLMALAIMATALVGYVALARFATQQLVQTGILAVVVWLGYLAIRAVTRAPPRQSDPVSEMLETRFGLDPPRRRQLAGLTEFALTFALFICALPLLMLQWGFSGADIRDGFKSIFFGLEIGQFKISLARILCGVVLFIALLLATRLFQRWLRERALQQTRMDPGIANSIETVAGYAGTGLACLLAISYAGFDITNLAIVAGALSVGIGFGLQSIVNNFVSGLILLIERPIKVGDWIVLGDQQGNVRRISVRATEIETFDRASLIIPNSELITGRVLNWTHRNSLGRVTLKVGVDYNADPEAVIALLQQCAHDHPQVLRAPQPRAVFDAFGASALEFSLQVHLSDVSLAMGVQSELRLAILKALRAAHIEIPFHQVDVNLRAAEAGKRDLAPLAADQGAVTPGQANAAAVPRSGKGAASDGS
jgi:potassium-dependent mechanosensitive channel